MVHTVCMPGKFAALCRKLTKDQRGIVEKIGLGSLLSIPSMPIQRMLVEKLVENFNAVDRTFTIQGHVVSISPWDVYCILGLVDKGEKIEISRKQADPKWFNLYKQRGDTAITFKHLEERIPREADADHFARMFVLYAIGTILAPASKEYVSSSFLELVVNVSRIKGLNWARFTLEHLLENLASFKSSKRSGIVGNLALFQVWFFEHFQADGDCFNYELHEHPLIKNWDETKVLKRTRLEAIKKFGAQKVVIELEPNESKVGTGNNNFDQEIGDESNEGMRHENFENEESNDNVEPEEVNQGDPCDAAKDEETKIKESMESIKFLFKRFPEFHTLVQMLVAGSNMSTKCEGTGFGSSGSSKHQESHSNYHKESEGASPASKMDKSDDVKPCPDPDITAGKFENVFASKSSSGAKRKIDLVSSPTLVEKVKTRTNRQPSKVYKSPYTETKQKRISKTKKNDASIDNITKGLNLSDLELHAISFILENFAIDRKKGLVRMDGAELCARQLNCLVRPMRDDEGNKWLGSRIIDSYATMFNVDWNKDTVLRKHAMQDSHCQWLRLIGADWIKTGVPRWRLCHDFAQKLVGADMVTLKS